MKQLLYFLSGVVVGSAVTYFVTKGYFKKLSDEEIASVKEVFSKRKPVEEKPVIEVKRVEQEEALGRIFSPSTEPPEELVPEEEDFSSEPKIIYPYEYGETGYDTVELIHFSDGYLTDDRHEIVEDITNTVGDDYADHFGEYEADSVFVRNDRLQTDYEILLDERSYISLISKYKGASMEWEDL